MNSGYFPVVVSPGVRPQTSDIQAPFYFGGSQVPNTIMTGGAIYNPTGDPAITKKNKVIHEKILGSLINDYNVILLFVIPEANNCCCFR